MWITGDLTEFPLPEVLTLLGHRNGELKLFRLKGQGSVTIHLKQSQLTFLTQRDDSIDQALAAKEALMSLMSVDQGNFEFERRLPKELNTIFNLPIEKLLLTAATRIDELDVYLPDCEKRNQRYTSSGPLDVWLDDDLFDFWQMTKVHLSEGACATDLAERLSLSLEQTQYFLEKLRSLGKIMPQKSGVVSKTNPLISRNF